MTILIQQNGIICHMYILFINIYIYSLFNLKLNFNIKPYKLKPYRIHVLIHVIYI